MNRDSGSVSFVRLPLLQLRPARHLLIHTLLRLSNCATHRALSTNIGSFTAGRRWSQPLRAVWACYGQVLASHFPLTPLSDRLSANYLAALSPEFKLADQIERGPKERRHSKRVDDEARPRRN